MATYVISDLHGQFDMFMNLLKMAELLLKIYRKTMFALFAEQVKKFLKRNKI